MWLFCIDLFFPDQLHFKGTNRLKLGCTLLPVYVLSSKKSSADKLVVKKVHYQYGEMI